MENRMPSLVPERFGPLSGVRILSSGTLIAQPFAASLAAEMGAEVIHIERPGEGDVWRKLGRPIKLAGNASVNAAWVQEKRNTFCITLDLGTPKGQELFLQFIAQADIWMESSMAGTYDGWGLDDETILRTNPSIVVAHVSGYGQSGHPDYLGRASYDVVAQAFGGMTNLTGSPAPEPPMRSTPLTADYLTALFCLWSSLAGYIHAQRTGQGQVIDLAQYEAIHQVLSGTMTAYFELGVIRERSGNRSGRAQPFGPYQAKDGWVIIAAVGTVFDRVCRILDLDPGEEKWGIAATETDSPEGIEFDAT